AQTATRGPENPEHRRGSGIARPRAARPDRPRRATRRGPPAESLGQQYTHARLAGGELHKSRRSEVKSWDCETLTPTRSMSRRANLTEVHRNATASCTSSAR